MLRIRHPHPILHLLRKGEEFRDVSNEGVDGGLRDGGVWKVEETDVYEGVLELGDKLGFEGGIWDEAVVEDWDAWKVGSHWF
jgi:hypothetical protein